MAKNSYRETTKVGDETMTTDYGRDRSDGDPGGERINEHDMIDRGITASIKDGKVPRDNG